MASGVLILMIVIWVVVTGLLKQSSGKKKNERVNRWHSEKLPLSGKKRRPAKSSDGHVLTGQEDITCRQFGHNHPEWEEPGTRYIVHDDPEEGFIILNGKKMRITEADEYENTI